MCLLVLAWNVHPDYRLVLAANRDEFHARPAKALGWWQSPRMLAGQDLQAGGTWLGTAPGGRFGVITNFRDLDGPLSGAPSRGRLIPEYMGSGAGARTFAAGLESRLGRYSGFNLLIGDPAHLYYITNRAAQPPAARELLPGVYGLSNHLLDTPWPKLVRARSGFSRLLAEGRPTPDALLEILTDREPAGSGDGSGNGVPAEMARALSAPLVVNPRFGTRCSTTLLIGRDGAMEVSEQSYAPDGSVTGREAFSLDATPPAPSP
jgi:uncharacterized protein with NRDE domain